jgi:hypothetical protein
MSYPVSEEEHFGILATVGGALAAWSKIEVRLNLLFGVLSGIEDRAKAGGIMDVILSFEVRLAICDKLMALEVTDPFELEMWARLSARIRKFHRKRHQIAHFSLVAGGERDGFHVPQISPFFSYEKWVTEKARYLSRQQIEERLLKFIEIDDAVDWFLMRALERARPEEYPMPDSEEPPLIPRIRALAIQAIEERGSPSANQQH